MSRLPLHARGLRIGLLGGSFNPPHEAHRAASLYAMKRLRLDRVWWLVTPGNPLKATDDLPPLGQRVAAARAVANHPRIDVTDIEARLGTRYSIDTLRALKRRYGSVHFVWLMGADNLAQISEWKDWQQIFHALPIAVFARPTYSLSALAAKAARRFAPYRLREGAGRKLVMAKPPAWLFVHARLNPISATEIRKRWSKTRN